MLIPYIEQVLVGVFIPNRKLHTAPMKQLGKYLKGKGYSIYYFEDTYRDETPVETWPHVDVILTFFSEGIDFIKIKKYAEMHKPLEINKIDPQFLLLDRRAVMSVLDKIGVPTALRITYNAKPERSSSVYIPPNSIEPHRAQKTDSITYKTKKENDTTRDKPDETVVNMVVERELSKFGIMAEDLFKPSEVRECSGNVLSIDNKRIEKPYVEKPVYSEDHNINIYYSTECKGRENGVCRLFRKIGSKSSNFNKNSQGLSYRENGSYIYEKYMEMVDYLDIKVYVLGKKVYAETRKSPVKDGIVIRSKSGKEERKEIKLTEKEIDAVVSVSKAFGQFICGMDVLRSSNGQFIVVDVNGWSFVKSNPTYYTQTYLKFLDKEIKQNLLKKRAQLGDTSRKEDIDAYRKIVELIGQDIKKEQEKKKDLNASTGSVYSSTKSITEEITVRDIEIKGIHVFYRHARRTPKLKKKLLFSSEYLLEYTSNGNASHIAGRDTSRIKEIEKLLDKERAERKEFRTQKNLIALESLKEITQSNTNVRVKISSEEKEIRVTLKWGGLLTELSKKEIEYEAMEYEAFISTIEGDSFSTGTHHSPFKPVSDRRTERKIRIMANPEDRTQKTAEIFRRVFQWTGRVNDQIREKYFSTSREITEFTDKVCSRLASAYAMLKEEMLYKEASDKLTIEPISAPLPDESINSCVMGEPEINSLYRNKLTVKEEPIDNGAGDIVKGICAGVTSTECSCKEPNFLNRWCFAFNEYPVLTPKNTKTVIPLLLDFITYDILSSQYKVTESPIFKYFKNIYDIFALFNSHANLMYKSRIETFFSNDERILDIIKYIYERISSQSDTIYITKKFTALVLLKYILSIKETVYTNKQLAEEIESIIHSIGFLSSITLMHLSCKGVEYILIKYSHGIHISSKMNAKKRSPPEQILRTDRKKILALIRKSVFFRE